MLRVRLVQYTCTFNLRHKRIMQTGCMLNITWTDCMSYVNNIYIYWIQAIMDAIVWILMWFVRMSAFTK